MAEQGVLKVACVVPTFNGRAELERLLVSLAPQTRVSDLIVIDSSSTDGTAELGRRHARQFISIAQRDFNHGATRQLAVDRLTEYDLLVFMTQDAVLATADAIERLVAPFDDSMVAAVCGRQLPHEDANAVAAHARLFNYPECSRVVRLSDATRWGLKVAFMSNSFAGYRRDALLSVGGFPSHVILAEDMYATARLLLAGWKVAYAADATCRHSHNYTVREEFKRYFDTGVFHSREEWIRRQLGGIGGEGRQFVLSELRHLGWRDFGLWPASIWRNAAKLAAFRLGRAERLLPLSLKRALSMHPQFWDSDAT